jgi:hypothetical protein
LLGQGSVGDAEHRHAAARALRVAVRIAGRDVRSNDDELAVRN